MTQEQPITSRENKLLLLIQKHINEFGQPPSNSWLSAELHISNSGVSNLKRKLKEKGFLDKNFKGIQLTQKAQLLLQRGLSKAITSISSTIPLLGSVKAGRTKPDEVIVDMPSIDEIDFSETTNFRTITIPVENKGITFALEVTGNSMEHENILEGDIVLVQPIDLNETITNGDLIIALYLPAYNEEVFDETLSGAIPIDYFEGPTIKYFYTEPNSKIARLSWKKSHDSSEYTIKSKEVRPIGKVVGVYREI